MRRPCFKGLEADMLGMPAYKYQSYASGLHPNVYSYKYYWWVFYKDSPCDGYDFLSDKYRLTTAAAFGLMQQLQKAGHPYWVYNKRTPRKSSKFSPPWNLNSPRWKDTEWAPSYPDDSDLTYKGHK